MTPYNEAGARLIDNGYPAIPIMPGTKRPGEYTMREWYGTSQWQRYCDRMPTDIEVSAWEKWPDAGVCVAIDHRLKVIDIDTDDSELMGAVLAVLPETPVKKRGAKGFSAFYRGSPAIVSAPFSVGKERIVDLLAHGRQTVLPPTIHPNTGLPYTWITDDTLIDTDLNQLPVLPDNIAELIANALAPYGYEPPAEYTPGDGDSLWRELNDTALLNLDRWVPDLKLPNTRKSGGGYRAVAAWRGVENANLGFHRDGIKDWGEDKAYTPLDVVMAAFTADLYTATKWLEERVGFKPALEVDDFDVAGFIARSKAKAEPVDKPLVAPAPVRVEFIDAPKLRVGAPRKSQDIDPFNVSKQGGLLQEISEWILDTARIPCAPFATIAALSFLAAFYGRRYKTPTKAGLNIYLVGIADAGFGKDHARSCVEELGHRAKMPWLIGPNDVTSDSAIEKVLRRRPCFVMPWDEIGLVLQSMSGKGGTSWARTVRKSLLELYSRSRGIWTGKEKADEKQDSSGSPVWNPTVSVLGFSTPTEFYKGITEDNFEDGFLARMVLLQMEDKDRPARRDGAESDKVPAELINMIQAQVTAAPVFGQFNNVAIRDPHAEPEMYKAGWTAEARERWIGIEQWQLAVTIERPDYKGIIGRVGENTIKLATIRAISRNPTRPRVELEDIEFAYAIVQRSIDVLDKGVHEYMYGSDFEALRKTIMRFVQDAGGEGIARSKLMDKRGVSKASQRDYEGAIKWLETTDRIESKISTGRGRPGVRYFAKEAA